MDEAKPTSIDTSKPEEKLSEADSGLKEKRPNSPTTAEATPKKKQKKLIWTTNAGKNSSYALKVDAHDLLCTVICNDITEFNNYISTDYFLFIPKGDKNNLSNNNNEKQDDVEKEDVKQNISSSTPTPIVSSREIVMILLKNKLFYFS
ncbi:hypothetical protein RclHR1_11040001 [Rhizophagus clarus]|uniref:Uncharacterized protein n=1 Tax=Rhizophagus clarus TaxID=94130 RepID=A0A2Z6Q4T6_9GLOM|nr:hypothetical protein RclHR1_11040001 [Rhizophagus clarus]